MQTKVELVGCDDTTEVELEVTEDQRKFLLWVAEKLNTKSTYGCMPVMSVDGECPPRGMEEEGVPVA